MVDDGAGVVAAERDLGGADEAGALALDGVDVGLRAARVESDALEDLGLGDVGGGEEGEALLHEDIERITHQGELEDDALVLEVVELGARDAGGGVEVDDVELGSELDVVLGLEREFRGLA